MARPDSGIEHRYRAVLDRIAQAARRAGRAPDDVRLIAVTKTVGPEFVRALHALGQRDFGESRVQELERKAAALADLADIRWHLIGHLQRNKVRKALPLCEVIHSIESLRLAETVNDEARRASRRARVLIEVNISGEETKYGTVPDCAAELFRGLSGLAHLQVDGLMTMAPLEADTAACRDVFRRLAALRDRLKAEFLSPQMPLHDLSMGMSRDFEAAIEEGATLVRVGTALTEGP